jgi:hypothetical protein
MESRRRSQKGAASLLAYLAALNRAGQITDRFGKAVGQLGSAELDVRLGGIYALERIARDSADDHPQVMEVLTAFVRVHAPLREQSSSGRRPRNLRRPAPNGTRRSDPGGLRRGCHPT